jgi:hypothetical protein
MLITTRHMLIEQLLDLLAILYIRKRGPLVQARRMYGDQDSFIASLHMTSNEQIQLIIQRALRVVAPSKRILVPSSAFSQPG